MMSRRFGSGLALFKRNTPIIMGATGGANWNAVANAKRQTQNAKQS